MIDLPRVDPEIRWCFLDKAEKAQVDEAKVQAASHAESDVTRIFKVMVGLTTSVYCI